MAVIMLMASTRKVMDKFAIPRSLRIFGWAATALLFLAAVGVLVTAG